MAQEEVDKNKAKLVNAAKFLLPKYDDLVFYMGTCRLLIRSPNFGPTIGLFASFTIQSAQKLTIFVFSLIAGQSNDPDALVAFVLYHEDGTISMYLFTAGVEEEKV